MIFVPESWNQSISWPMLWTFVEWHYRNKLFALTGSHPDRARFLEVFEMLKQIRFKRLDRQCQRFYCSSQAIGDDITHWNKAQRRNWRPQSSIYIWSCWLSLDESAGISFGKRMDMILRCLNDMRLDQFHRRHRVNDLETWRFWEIHLLKGNEKRKEQMQCSMRQSQREYVENSLTVIEYLYG